MSLEDAYAPLSEEEREPAAKGTTVDKVPIVPVPEDAPEVNFRHPRYGKPVHVWAYLLPDGALAGYDARFDYIDDGKPAKDILPLAYCQMGERCAWRAKALPAPRPLYGLNLLAGSPEAPVVVVEGCKTADAARVLLPGYVAVTWQGGGNAVHMTDWSVLAGRDVLLWPDRDRHCRPDNSEKPYEEQPGTLTVRRIAARLNGVARSLWELDLSALDVPDGWDAADALEEDWTADRAQAFVAELRREAMGRPTIRVVAGSLHTMATEAEDALISARAPFYVRGGIVRPIVDEVQASHGRMTRVARLAPVDSDTLVDHLSRYADWVMHSSRKKEDVRTDPPAKVAATLLSRDGEWRLPQLAGVITTPTLRPDGSLLTEPGYDADTRLLLLRPPVLPALAANPTKADAEHSLALLDRLLNDFPFVDAASRSVALSALITPVVRGAMPVVPMHATTAPVAGSGKSYIIDLAGAILHGDRAPVIAAGRNEEETEKRFVAAVLSGQSIISVDNVNGQLGGDFLCQLIERPVFAVRPLGGSRHVRVESRASTFATGNNIQLVGDMTRRVILCSLDPNVERPELRIFGGDPFGDIIADRGPYIAAALTIVRAYAAAGFPGELPPLASFEHWSRFVRSALVWLGRADPCKTMEAARSEDPITASLGALFSVWYTAFSDDNLSAGKVKDRAETRDTYSNLIYTDLHQVLVDVAESRGGTIDAKRLGKFLGRHKGRIVNGLKLMASDDSHSKQKLWSVRRAD